MIKKTKFSIQLKFSLILMIILISSMYFNNLSNNLDLLTNSENNSNDGMDESNFRNVQIEDIKSSVLGNNSWWDANYQYRQLINITNPYSVNFTDYGVSVSFIYTELVQTGKMQSDLDDIRIVENDLPRNYYVAKDYPQNGYATVFFDTNITKNTPDLDTYIYFGYQDAGNAESEQASETFGWVKNGNFELDVNTSDNFNPYGWAFSHEPINRLQSIADNVPNNARYDTAFIDNFINKLSSSPTVAERVAEGTYSYKWGSDFPKLSDPNVLDYAGTFYSYPFKIPIVEGGGISLHIYRNVRTWYFEYWKNQDIDKDGYFMRLCNGTSSEYSSNPDNHKDLDPIGYTNYIEAYGGYGEKKGPKYKKEDQLIKHLHDTSDVVYTASYNSSDGGLTGPIDFDMSNYMGKEIFLELGAWGNEDGTNDKSAFFQVDDVRFNYTLTTEIQEIQEKVSSITIIAKDIDERIVPGAKVYLVNNSDIKYSGTTDSGGYVSFTNIPNGYYDIIVNYTIGALTEVVFNSTESDGPYYLNGIQYLKELNLDIWTIDFEIVDRWGIPLSLGYIEVYKESGPTELMATLTLSSRGTATFRWRLDDGDYYYQVYYKNNDFSSAYILLNESYIKRSDYDKVNEKYVDYSNIYVNNTNILDPSENHYKVNETIYTNGNKKIIAFNITLTNMKTRLDDVSIYYLDKDNETGSANLIYYESGYDIFEDSDSIKIDIALVDNDKLESENRDVYGLNIVINGDNSSRCDGVIKIDTIETCNIYNKTDLARLNIRVIYITPIDPEGAPTSAFVKIKDNETDDSLINMTSDKNKDGYTYGSENVVPFWYKIGYVLNFSIDVANFTMVNFNVTNIDPSADDQYRPETNEGIPWYNFTFNGYRNANITFNIIFTTFVNFTYFQTNFTAYYGETQATWGGLLSYWVNFTYSKDNGRTWTPVTDPLANCYLKIIMEDTLILRLRMNPQGNGNFSISFDTSRISAGLDLPYQAYDFDIEGIHPSYDDPDDAEFSVKVYALLTGIRALDQTLTVVVDDPPEISEYYDKLVNITIWYYDLPDVSLEDATVTYKWIGVMQDYEPMNAHPTIKGYYYITLDTGSADAGNYKIYVTAKLENHAIQKDFIIFLDILNRKTTLNNKEKGIVQSPYVWVGNEELFTFLYKDYDSQELLGEARAYYFWWDWVDGNVIEGSGGGDDLIENADDSYTFDFNTGTRHVGYYFIEIHIEKDNYEPKSAIMILEIRLREFDSDLDATNLDDDQITVVKGEDVKLEIELLDTTRGNIPLRGANVVLEIGDDEYEFDEDDPGIYTYTFSTDEIDAFFTSQTFTGQIVIKATNFTSDEIDITIVVTMEELFPGMPTFYFIMLVAVIAGTLGGLVSYRAIQQARIPKHVKKIRLVKKKIKARDSVPSISIPTKEQMIMKQFSGAWKDLDLSLEDTLGIKEVKSKIPAEEKPPLKQKGGEE